MPLPRNHPAVRAGLPPSGCRCDVNRPSKPGRFFYRALPMAANGDDAAQRTVSVAVERAYAANVLVEQRRLAEAVTTSCRMRRRQNARSNRSGHRRPDRQLTRASRPSPVSSHAAPCAHAPRQEPLSSMASTTMNTLASACFPHPGIHSSMSSLASSGSSARSSSSHPSSAPVTGSAGRAAGRGRGLRDLSLHVPLRRLPALAGLRHAFADEFLKVRGHDDRLQPRASHPLLSYVAKRSFSQLGGHPSSPRRRAVGAGRGEVRPELTDRKVACNHGLPQSRPRAPTPRLDHGAGGGAGRTR